LQPPPSKHRRQLLRFGIEGFEIKPQLVGASRLARLRFICEHVLVQVRDRALTASGGEIHDTTNIAYLTDPRWFAGQPNLLRDLLEFVASEPLLDWIRKATGQQPIFHNTQYFPHPETRSWLGDWHRDCQFLATPTVSEDAIRAEETGVHLRIALVDDDNLEFVPGSQGRPDNEAERAARFDRRDVELPDAQRIDLRAGDGLLFHAWGIHRGRYNHRTARATLDIIYALGQASRHCPEDGFAPAPPMTGLSPAAAAFFSDPATRYAR
jgi:hypothetical protein